MHTLLVAQRCASYVDVQLCIVWDGIVASCCIFRVVHYSAGEVQSLSTSSLLDTYRAT